MTGYNVTDFSIEVFQLLTQNFVCDGFHFVRLQGGRFQFDGFILIRCLDDS
jgi:hypothetical protein